MNYTVEVTNRARQELGRIDRQYRGRVERAIEVLSYNPTPRQSEQLQGYRYTRRLRVGRYRVIYEVYDEVLVVVVIRAVPRSEDTYRL